MAKNKPILPVIVLIYLGLSVFSLPIHPNHLSVHPSIHPYIFLARCIIVICMANSPLIITGFASPFPHRLDMQYVWHDSHPEIFDDIMPNQMSSEQTKTYWECSGGKEKIAWQFFYRTYIECWTTKYTTHLPLAQGLLCVSICVSFLTFTTIWMECCPRLHKFSHMAIHHLLVTCRKRAAIYLENIE